jgi:hypothetical protein
MKRLAGESLEHKVIRRIFDEFIEGLNLLQGFRVDYMINILEIITNLNFNVFFKFEF